MKVQYQYISKTYSEAVRLIFFRKTFSKHGTNEFLSYQPLQLIAA